MISAITQVPGFKKVEVESCLMGGTLVTNEHLKMAKETLGARKAMDGFGMTESGLNWLHVPGKPLRWNYPMPGCRVRICDPESGKVVLRGEGGELHLGGPMVVEKYLLSEEQGQSANEIFYEDRAGRWMKTGDRATMAENGEISLIGRYKDMIIRGGENISPASIENVLKDEFGLVAEVIGVPDEVAVRRIPRLDYLCLRGRSLVGMRDI